VLQCLRGAAVTLAEVLGQYHARGVVSLRRRPLRLREMIADPPPWTGTVTAPSLLSPLEVQCRVVQAIERSTYSWPPARLLPMLPHEGTEKFVSQPSRCILFVLCFCCDVDLIGSLLLELTPPPSYRWS
jgi:hypothetical protein